MFDWNVVGEIALGVALGIIAGGVVVTSLLRSLAYEVLSHSTTRKLAQAAEKLSGKGGGGLLDSLLGALTK